MAKSRTKASLWPVLLGVLSFLTSLVLAVLPLLKLVSISETTTSLVGWLLASVTVFTLYGIDHRIQNSPKNAANFGYRSGYSRTLALLAYASLLLTFAHVWRWADLWSRVS